MNSSSPDPLFMSAKEAARLAGLSPASIYHAINRGELEAVRLCSRYRIRRSTFDGATSSWPSPTPSTVGRHSTGAP
jgi:excisionase family DNA binding protein